MIIALVSDLIFRSKIQESIKESLRFVKTREALERELAGDGKKEVLIDLHLAGVDPMEAISACAADPSVGSIIAFASHVEKDLMEQAHQAGATAVLPRSKFVTWLAGHESERGAAAITLLVFGAIVFCALYYLYHVIPFFYDYYELENQMQASIHLAMTENDDVIKRKVQRTIKELEIPVDPAALLIRRQNNHMDLRIKYREVFYITFRGKDYIIQTFDFDAHAYGDF